MIRSRLPSEKLSFLEWTDVKIARSVARKWFPTAKCQSH